METKVTPLGEYPLGTGPKGLKGISLQYISDETLRELLARPDVGVRDRLLITEWLHRYKEPGKAEVGLAFEHDTIETDKTR